MEHYYSKLPISELNETIIEKKILGLSRNFFTGSGVFSKNGVDFGSHLLIETFLNDYEGRTGTVIDLGCGYGPIGIFIASFFKNMHIEMVDINERAVELSRKNIESNKIKNAVSYISDGFSEVKRFYDAIVTNPPIRAGKKVVFSFYDGAYENLKDGGSFYCVIQKKQGADSSVKKLKELFGNCEVINRQSGYRILKSVK
ncbi:MAG: class I SAM-dependent methyltransferase [Clostridia bacterium]|nr:class I SAM-dependent methyltransferase [Clostridia bacterium]